MKQTSRKYNQDVSIKDIFYYYCFRYFKEYPLKKDGTISKRPKVYHDSIYNVSITDYHNILKDFYGHISERILKGEDFKMFERLGTIGIRKNKIHIKINKEGDVITNAPIDFKKTMELWQDDSEAKEKKVLVRHLNEHTNRYIHRWYWDKSVANFRNKIAYAFIPSRKNKRKLSKKLKSDDNVDYYTRYNKNKQF